MENILLIIIIEFFNFIFFVCGYRSSRNTTKRKPSINPVEIYKEHKEQKKQQEEYEKQQEEIQKELENIENYDGTDLGQKDI